MFTLILYGFLVPILWYFLLRQLRWHTLPKISIFYFILSCNIIGNLVSFLLQKKLLMGIQPAVLPYLGLFLLTGLLCYFISSWIIKRKQIACPKKSLCVMVMLSTFLFVYFGWFLSSNGRMPFDQLLYNLKTPLNTEANDFTTQILSMLLSIAFIILPACSILWRDPTLIKSKPLPKGMRLRYFIVYGLMFMSWIALPWYTFHLENAYTYFTSKEDIYAESYVSPSEVELTFPDQKRNLILIFVESFESTFFSEAQGGIESDELMPHMATYMQKGENFSANSLFGGAINMPSINWTLAGMSATLGGVNYNMPTNINEEEGDLAVLPGLITLNDVLAKENYQQSFFLGVNSALYHMRHFYEYHGNAQVYDVGHAKKDGFIPEDYKQGWGMEDRTLFEYVKSKTMEIQSTQPFAMFISTNDLHGPNGYRDATCPTIYNDYRDVISCSDESLAQFLDWIKSQPFYEDTTVVVLGDHLTHAEDYFKRFPSDVNRSVFNLFLNSASPYTEVKTKQREFFAVDYFPTILSAMGVEIQGDRLGLGYNLYSGKPTLIEQDGKDVINQKLIPNSDTFNEMFLNITKDE